MYTRGTNLNQQTDRSLNITVYDSWVLQCLVFCFIKWNYKVTSPPYNITIRSRTFTNLCECGDFPEQNEWLSTQQPWYLIMAPNSKLFLLYSSLFTCPLMPLFLRQILSNCDHILAILFIKIPTAAISVLWVTLCTVLGNITLRDLGRPFKRRQQCFSGIPQRICTFALELEGGQLTFLVIRGSQFTPVGVQKKAAQTVFSWIKDLKKNWD